MEALTVCHHTPQLCFPRWKIQPFLSLWIAKSVLNKGKPPIPPLLNGLQVFSPASDRARTNLKLHNNSVTPKMVKQVITNLDLAKASGPDCITVVALKNCQSELSYMLAELLKKCLNESCFPDCWKVSWMVPLFKNVEGKYTAKNYCPVSLLSVVSKVFEKIVNNRIVNNQ